MPALSARFRRVADDDHVPPRYWALVRAIGGICLASGCMASGTGRGVEVVLPTEPFEV